MDRFAAPLRAKVLMVICISKSTTTSFVSAGNASGRGYRGIVVGDVNLGVARAADWVVARHSLSRLHARLRPTPAERFGQ